MQGAISDDMRHDFLQPILRKSLDVRKGGVEKTSRRLFCIVTHARWDKEVRALSNGG